MATLIKNFSRLSSTNKINVLLENIGLQPENHALLDSFRNQNQEIQKILEELSENTLTSFPIPFGIAPNFLINGKVYHIPLVTEESSVIAALSKAAKIWVERGGFHATVKSTLKSGQVHFLWSGDPAKISSAFTSLERLILEKTAPLTINMKRRGGGIKKIELIDKTQELPNYYQILLLFDTVDAMGANFINSCLEETAKTLEEYFSDSLFFSEDEKKIEIIMSILSNYNPLCLVESYVECSLEELPFSSLKPADYARKFETAIKIAKLDVSRAVTNNKGIFNGIDAISIATGNDFRAIEAGGHAYAARSGTYQSLTTVDFAHNRFRFSIEIPLSVGTTGGITQIHPLAKLSHAILENPDAKELMMIMASVGLASNFAAVNALITSGIQSGHMKLHLSNILNQLGANEEQKAEAISYFENKPVAFSSVQKFLNEKS